MHRLLNTLTNLHGALGKPMTRSSVLSLCKLVENIKSIEYIYSRHSTTIAKAVHHMIQRLTYQALSIIATVKVISYQLLKHKFWTQITKTNLWFSSFLQTKISTRKRIKINSKEWSVLNKSIGVINKGLLCRELKVCGIRLFISAIGNWIEIILVLPDFKKISGLS